MRNQILFTFLIIGIMSITILAIGPKKELIGDQNLFKEKEVYIKKINVFKWTTDRNYRRNYIKRINEKI